MGDPARRSEGKSEARIIVGDCLRVLRTLPSGSVRVCVTSPPYWGLRDYGHDGQLGLEATPELYASNMVEIFREVRRVLADDGTLWLNLGDSYAAQRGGTEMPAETLAGGQHGKAVNVDSYRGRGFSAKMLTGQEGAPSRNLPVAHRNARAFGLKHKDLIGIPWRVAFALQADGWYLRQDIIWSKPNPMPESVKDRCTKAHEYIFLLSKSERYYFDSAAMREPCSADMQRRAAAGHTRGARGKLDSSRQDSASLRGVHAKVLDVSSGRNRRSVWTVPTKPFRGAHFATYPPELIEPCIAAGSERGDVVLDPFNGAGTTGLIALRHNRSYVGIEINPEYASMSAKRLRDDVGLLASVSMETANG